MFSEYERQFRKGSRCSSMDHAPLCGTIEQVYRTNDSNGYRVRVAAIQWDDGNHSTISTASLIARRDIAQADDEMSSLRADTNTPSFTHTEA